MARNPLSPSRPGGLADRGFGEDPFMSLHRQMNRLFDDVFRGLPVQGSQAGSSGSFVPTHMDVSETENELRIYTELPGVNQDDIDITLDNDVLTIRGEKKLERDADKENYHFMERSYGSFQRSLRLPFAVDPGQVRAELMNGVLTVTLPKERVQTRSNRIQIQGGGQGVSSAKEKPSSAQPQGRTPDKASQESKR
jgi:HSP20 family protein